MQKTAVRPDFFANFASLKKKEDELNKKGITEEEQAYYSMSLSKGWQLFSNDAQNLLKELDLFVDNAVIAGLSREEIGEKTIVVSLAKGVIRRLLEKVEDCKEACEQPEGGK